jgi:hypothetical protein
MTYEWGISMGGIRVNRGTRSTGGTRDKMGATKSNRGNMGGSLGATKGNKVGTKKGK